jgi:signal transduction histidine kinase
VHAVSTHTEFSIFTFSDELSMARLGQASFRSILLGVILLLSIPTLLVGLSITHRKARSSLLDTARQNLEESAIRKGESVANSFSFLKENLLLASSRIAIERESPAELQNFLQQLKGTKPTKIYCLQVVNTSNQKTIASTSTCENLDGIASFPDPLWPQTPATAELDTSTIRTSLISLPATASGKTNSEMGVVLNAPVYVSPAEDASTKKLQYVLRAFVPLRQSQRSQPSEQPGSLTGYTVLINEDGTILEHPNDPSRVGNNIANEPDAGRLQSIMNSALSGRENFVHLFQFDRKNKELIAGYTAIDSPVNPDKKWVVLAVTRLDFALSGLNQLRQLYGVLLLGLLAANFLVTLYLAPLLLARPLERLGEYALNVQCHTTTEPVPNNFRVREFNQLAEALNAMVDRLKTWAEELNAAWHEAKVANRLKNEFLANISHELRTPLNAIIGSIRLIRDGFCDDREEEMGFLMEADEAAIHLLDLISDLLDLAKIEAGKLSIHLQSVNLQEILDEAIESQKSHIQEKGLQLYQQKSDRDTSVKADPSRLQQVFFNIINNAIKFTDKGSITIITEVKKLENEENNKFQVLVTVQDTGIGIDPNLQSQLFQPFVMVDGSTTRSHGGTGLGLAISRNLVELMGGQIILESPGNNEGTTVTICLPLLSNHSNRTTTNTSQDSSEETMKKSQSQS